MTLTIDRPYTAPVCPGERPCRALTLPSLTPCGHAATHRAVLSCGDHDGSRIDLCETCLMRVAIGAATCGVDLPDGGTCDQRADLIDTARLGGGLL